MIWNTRVIWKIDSEGIEGWCLKRNPFFGASSAQGLVHDILEHSRNDRGTYREEISAYGAILAWRLNTEYLYPNDPINIKAIELGKELGWNILFHALHKKPLSYFEKFPNTKSKYKSPYSETVAQNTIDELLPDFTFDAKKLFNWIVAWLNNGYSRAMKIIRKLEWDVQSVYETILSQIKAILFHPSFDHLAEASIQIDFDRCWCEIIPIRYFR